jgi:hypothetical protein
MRFNFKDSPVLSPCLFEQEQSQAQLCHWDYGKPGQGWR